MLCKRPNVSGSVFPGFDPGIHVREEIPNLKCEISNCKSEISNFKSEISDSAPELSLAVDFGFAAPFVCLWIRTFGDGRTHVIDEYLQPGVQMETHIEQIKRRRHGAVVRLACDPAGAGRND